MIPDNSKQHFWLHIGHLDIDGKETKTFYFFRYAKDKDPKLVLHCQLCDTIRDADEDEDGWPMVAPKCGCETEVASVILEDQEPEGSQKQGTPLGKRIDEISQHWLSSL